MAFTSYAQNFEDVILNRYFSDISNGFYVDVGAWDPVFESVTKSFYDSGWSGINIEPSPTYSRLFIARPRDINLNIALGEHPGKRILRVYRDAHIVLQASTLLPSVPPRIPNQAELQAADVMVDVMTLTAVLDEHAPGKHIHFLKIDVEGAEEAVIRGADWQRHRPEVVLIEATHPQTTERSDEIWRPLMISAGYMPVLFDGLNAWFLREESGDRAGLFNTPPNVFDNFRIYDAGSEHRIAEAEERARLVQAPFSRLAIGLARRLRKTARLMLAPLRRYSPAKEKEVRPITPETFVRALYLGCLGREPEPSGLADWTKHLRRDNNPLLVARLVSTSAEALARFTGHEASDPSCQDVARAALRLVGRRPRIVDVGAQILRTETHVYDALRILTPLDVIGFDPLEQRVAERAAVEPHEGLTLLPYAIGDGEKHTLYINNDDATTSLYPLNLRHNTPFNHLRSLRTLRTVSVQTRRLDDVLPPGPIDFMKLDIQGAELMALRHASETLARTAVVHCEVEFSQIYEGQPLYPEIHRLLAEHQFELIDLVNPGRYYYPQWAEMAAAERLLWADAIFFRKTDEAEVLVVQSLIAAAIYRKATLARHLLFEASSRHGTPCLPGPAA